MEASQVAFQRLDGEPPLALRLSWAVPTSRAPRAAGNVLGLRLPREAENIEEEVILDTRWHNPKWKWMTMATAFK